MFGFSEFWVTVRNANLAKTMIGYNVFQYNVAYDYYLFVGELLSSHTRAYACVKYCRIIPYHHFTNFVNHTRGDARAYAPSLRMQHTRGIRDPSKITKRW